MPYQLAKLRFDPVSTRPFKVSRSKIELFMKCPRCFYMDRRYGIGYPSSPPFTLNTAVDGLLKKEFDAYRTAQQPHSLMQEYGINAIPFDHEDLPKWRENFVGVQHHHQPTNFIVFGAIDDIWINNDGELHIVDYKATAKDSEINLDAEWQNSYKRQAEIYQWLFKMNGFKVSPVAYFVYVNGKKNATMFDGKLEFDIHLLPYEGNCEWVERTLLKMRECLCCDDYPECTEECEFCCYVRELQKILC